MAKSILILLAVTFAVAVLRSQTRYPAKQLTPHDSREGFFSWLSDGSRKVLDADTGASMKLPEKTFDSDPAEARQLKSSSAVASGQKCGQIMHCASGNPRRKEGTNWPFVRTEF
jgi:hypothetical protein